mmetsp:Transcript_38376/g.57484  ORF Transcript_38376/g.57484 Transcript_38376/m.57484 type:complete len:100 (+) Transcript_38376:1090-1389(+)
MELTEWTSVCLRHCIESCQAFCLEQPSFITSVSKHLGTNWLFGNYFFQRSRLSDFQLLFGKKKSNQGEVSDLADLPYYSETEPNSPPSQTSQRKHNFNL